MDAFDTYLRELARIDSLDSSTDELSFYTALDNFLSAVGEELDPSVTAVMQLGDPPRAKQRSDRFDLFGSTHSTA